MSEWIFFLLQYLKLLLSLRSRVVSLDETFRNLSNLYWTNGMGSTTRMRMPGISHGSRIGGNETTALKNKGIRNLPYLEYVRWREERRCFHYGGVYCPGHCFPEKKIDLSSWLKMRNWGTWRMKNQMRLSSIWRKIRRTLIMNFNGWTCQYFCVGGMTQSHTMKL